ncbi:MAG: hypothetical protein WAT43_19485 [Chitinophagales bacterium]
MPPKLRPNFEKFLITIRYLQNWIDKKPEVVNDFLIKNELIDTELGISPLDLFEIICGTIDFFIEIPDYNFSQLISAEEYAEKVDISLKFITINYLDVANNGLNAKDKKYILKGLQQFYLVSENNLIPFNQYNATKHDRIAYSTLASAVFVITLSVIVASIAKGWKTHAEQQKTDINNVVAKKIPILEEKTLITGEPYVDISEYLSQSPSAPVKSQSIEKKNPLMNIYDAFKNLEKDIHLDNKSLVTHHIKTIFKEVNELMPKLSLHRRQIITGYLALNFGIIKESDYKPATSSYNSLNNFLKARIKGVLSKT